MRKGKAARSGRRNMSRRRGLAALAVLAAAAFALPQTALAATGTISSVAGSDPFGDSPATADPHPRLLSTNRPGWR